MIFSLQNLLLTAINLGTLHVMTEKAGLNFEPKTDKENLIWYTLETKSDYKSYTKQIDNFLSEYNIGRGQNILYCDYNSPAPDGGVCDVDVKNYNPCVAGNYYGYHKFSPCIFLKFDGILNWTPEYYNRSDSLPEEMPKDLKNYINQLESRNDSAVNTLWVSCDGEWGVDKENIGPIQYIPRRGFPSYYFPYKGQDGYLNPVIAIQLERPTLGVVIKIECKAWAHNIKHSGSDLVGVTNFAVLLDLLVDPQT